MKIALLSFEYPPETGFGGIGTYTWYQARGMARLGHEVHVLAGATDPTELVSDVRDGVHVHRYRAHGPWMRVFRRLGKHQLWWTQNRMENALSMHRGLRRLLERHDFDVIEMPECGAEGSLINRLDHPHTLIKFHSPAALIMPYYEVRPADIRWCSRVEEWGIQAAGALTSCSRFLAEEVAGKMKVRRPIQVIPNGIDLDLFDTSEQVDARERFDLPRDRPMIFFAGRMEPRKGVHLFRDVVAPILDRHEVAFVFAGQDLFGTMEQEILPFLRGTQRRGSVHYVGKLDLTEVRSCLRQTDLFFIPSTWENCPYSCLEAMAAGRAIVSSDAGGLPELVQDGETGLLAPSEDVPAFVAAIERLLEDPDLRERLGANARRRVEQSYTDVHIAQRTVDHYRACFGTGA